MTSLTDAQQATADELARKFALIQLTTLMGQRWTDDEKRQILRATLDILDRAYTATCVELGFTVQ